MGDRDLNPVELQRLRNLRRLIDMAGGPKLFLERTGLPWTPSYLSQLAGPNPTRALTEKTARHIESAGGMAPGALDQDDLLGIRPTVLRAPEHFVVADPQTRNVQSNMLAAAIQVVSEVVSEYENGSFNPGRHARIVALVYEDALRRGAIDASYVRDLLEIQRSR